MGEIFTFYSFKGGTGRSMAVANLAWILASNHQRVLVVDWDLEAPGLHRYFGPFLRDPELSSTSGVIDLMIEFAEKAMTPLGNEDRPDEEWYRPYANFGRHAVTLDWVFPGGGAIDFVPAGKHSSSYAKRVNSFSWEIFYEKLGGASFLEETRRLMRRDYDYVLIDSRTGYSDTSGICTISMPDNLVICFTLNNQGIVGAASVARTVWQQRLQRQGLDRFRIFPVPMRVDDSEMERLRSRQDFARLKFTDFMSTQAGYWGEVEVRYIPFYAYEETLAAFVDRPGDVNSTLAVFERLCAHLTDGRVTKLNPPSDVDRERILRMFRDGSGSTSQDLDSRVKHFALEDSADESVERVSIRRVEEAVNNRFTTLSLAGLQIKSLPSDLKRITTMAILDLGDCGQLQDLTLLQGHSELHSLNLSACRRVQDFHPLSTLMRLQSLNLSYCDQLQDLQPLAALTSLQSLNLSGCAQVQDLQPLAALTSLQSLNLSGCAQVQDLQPLAALTSLKLLNLSNCAQLQDMQPLTALINLQSVDISGCAQLKDLHPITALTKLQSVDLSGCTRLQELRPIIALNNLESLDLGRCDQLPDLGVLEGLLGLAFLNLSGCSQLESVDILRRLTSLQSLDLSNCAQLQDLQPLTALTNLQSLDLTCCSQVQEFKPLATLTSLQALDLSHCDQLQDLQALASLTSLQSLDLSYCAKVQDLQPLASLTSLQSLNLNSCDQLEDLQPLAALASLQSLKLSACAQLDDLRPLAALASLQSLDLSCCDQLEDLQPLAALASLQSLKLGACAQLQDLQPLAALTSLQSLDLSCCDQLEDLQPLAALASLQSINLSYSDRLKSLQPLAAFRSLRNAVLMGLKIDCSPGALPLAAWNQAVGFYADQLIGAPNELSSLDSYSDNALPRIRAWQRDLLAGEASNSTIKIFFLGNGRVGKTQICRRLLDKDFDPSVPTTHGIDIQEHQIVPASGSQPEIIAQLWDFSGQSIYHGTHRLFIDDRAIYVLAWTPGYENSNESEQEGIPMRNRSLRYWMEYVNSLAGESVPVIVVQTQCDRQSDRREPPLPAEHGFERLLSTYCSAKEPNGMRRLRLELESAALYQMERYGKVRLPRCWCSVERQIEALRHQKTKTISYTEFETLCREGHQAAVPEVVLQYLHRSGQVFYRRGAFGDQVIIDPDWAFDGIYAVLDRQRALPVLKAQAGRFTPQLLALLVWPQYSRADQALFISLMQQCQICFKTANDSYIATDALPSELQAASQIQLLWYKTDTPDAAASLTYPFLHEGVLRAILCGVGGKAGESAVYWAWGVCFYDVERQSTARIRSELADPTRTDPAGRIIVEATGGQAEALVSHLIDSILQIEIGTKPQHQWVVGGRMPSARQGTSRRLNADEAFARIAPAQPPRRSGEPLPVYVSYAWGSDSEALLDAFARHLPNQFQLIRDETAMLLGDRISSFMRNIGRAEHILVVLSEKYLKSVYCMRELLYLYNASLGERVEFLDRVVVLTVGEIKISRASDRLLYSRYWQMEEKKADDTVKQLGRLNIGDADRAEHLAIKDFAYRVSDLLYWVSEILMPGATNLNEQNVDRAVRLLRERTDLRSSGHK